MILDILFFDKNGKFIQSNFQLPNDIDFSKYGLPISDTQKYEIFGAICIDKQMISQGNYLALVKKKHKKTKQMQWYEFGNGTERPISITQYQNDYIP